MAIDNPAYKNPVNSGVIGDFLHALFVAGAGQSFAESFSLGLRHLFHSHRVNDKLQQVKCRGMLETSDVRCEPARALAVRGIPRLFGVSVFSSEVNHARNRSDRMAASLS